MTDDYVIQWVQRGVMSTTAKTQRVIFVSYYNTSMMNNIGSATTLAHVSTEKQLIYYLLQLETKAASKQASCFLF